MTVKEFYNLCVEAGVEKFPLYVFDDHEEYEVEKDNIEIMTDKEGEERVFV